MASLTGQTIQSTYDALLKISGNDALTSSLQRITDGLGNFSPLYLSTTAVEISSGLNVVGSITGSNLSGTNTGDETNSTIKSKLGAASSSNDGYLTSTDWSTFNAKQNALGYTPVPQTRTLTINGETYDLSANRSWTLATGVTSFNTRTGAITLTSGDVTGALGFTPYNATNPSNYIALTALSASSPLSYNNLTGAFSIQQASGSQNGFLSSTDWTTFNNKQNALTNPITGTMTAGRVPRALTSTTLGDSNIYTAADESIGLMTGIGGSPNDAPTPHILYVNGNSYLNGNLTASGNVTAASIIRSGGTSAQILAANGSVITAGSNITISGGTISANNTSQWITSGSNIYYNTGNVGIGTSSPSQRLHIGGVGSAIAFDTTGAAGTSIIQTVEDYKLSLKSNRGTSTEIRIGDSNLEFFSNSTERMRITSGGNVGIGTTTLPSILTVGDNGTGLQFTNAASGAFNIGLLAGTGSPDAYIYNRANSPLIIGTNNAERMRITSGGNVGIGTTSPNEKLSVIGAISANNGMIVQGYSAAASGLNCEMGVVSGYVQYNAYNRSTSAYGQFRLDGSSLILNAGSGGNVGIGTTSPQARLHSNSDILTGYFQNGTNGIYDALKLTNNTASNTLSGNGARIQFYNNANNGTTLVGSSIRSVNVDYGWASDLVLSSVQNNGYSSQTVNDAIWIKNTGNVGIGTSSPASILNVSGGNVTVSAGFGIAWSGDQTRIMTPEDNVSGALIRYGSGGIMRFVNGSTEHMRISGTGNVGIGTSSPSRKLSVSGQTYLGGDTFVASNGGIFFSGDGSYNAGVYGRNSGLDLVLQANNSERMRINSGGFVTIAGTTTYNNSVVSIEVSTDQSGITTNVNSSDTRYHLYFRNTLATVGSISTNTYATSFNTSSDYRLKEDFKPFNGLSILNDIKVYDFKWKGVEQRNYGVVAHEIAEVIPYAVNGEKDGEMHQSVDYSKLVPVLIQAMQEQQKQIDELKAKLENGI